MLWQWKLHDESVHVGILVELLHLLEEEVLCDVFLEAEESGGESTCLTCQHFVLHIGLTTSVVTHEDGCEMWTLASCIHNLFHFFCNLSLDGCCCCFSVYQLHIS